MVCSSLTSTRLLHRPGRPPPVAAALCDLNLTWMKSETAIPDWNKIRAEYENSADRLADILARHDISRPQFDAEWKRRGWPRRHQSARAGRRDLVARLMVLLERQIATLEKEMGANTDKEVAILGNLTKNLEKLIELDRKQKDTVATASRRADIDVLRQRLSRRIEQLKNH